MGPEMGWAGRPGPISAHPAACFCERFFPCLLECSPFYMCDLDVNFPAVWKELLVSQDSAFSVQVLGVFRLHGVVLGLLGVLFTSLLDLCLSDSEI
jgi:hypothetical protein